MDNDFAEHLIVRFLSNEATPKEQMALHEWVSQNADNKKLYTDFCTVWRRNLPNGPEFDTVAAIQRLDSRINEHTKKTIVPMYWVRIAAGFILISLISWSLYYSSQNLSTKEEVAMLIRTTSSGQKRSIQLSDGTKIMLNANSTIKWPGHFNAETRDVFLEGEAFFEVAHDKSHPFIVHTSTLNTKVLGTSFNIRQSGDVVAITLATGKIEITGKNVAEVLSPSEKLTYDTGKENWIRENAELEKELAWKNGTIILENERLENAITRLETWYNVRILFETEAIKNCRVTGKFKDETLENVLSAISDATGIQYVISKQNVKLSGIGCN